MLIVEKCEILKLQTFSEKLGRALLVAIGSLSLGFLRTCRFKLERA